jgi:hypothetical protein
MDDEKFSQIFTRIKTLGICENVTTYLQLFEDVMGYKTEKPVELQELKHSTEIITPTASLN